MRIVGSEESLSEQPITSRHELVERVIAAFGKPARMNSKELIWSSVDRQARHG